MTMHEILVLITDGHNPPLTFYLIETPFDANRADPDQASTLFAYKQKYD